MFQHPVGPPPPFGEDDDYGRGDLRERFRSDDEQTPSAWFNAVDAMAPLQPGIGLPFTEVQE